MESRLARLCPVLSRVSKIEPLYCPAPELLGGYRGGLGGVVLTGRDL